MGAAAQISDAVVLRTVSVREADLIVTLYTREHGKLSALARGAKRSRKRFGAALALFVLGRAQLSRRPNAELWTLVRFDVLMDYMRISTDLISMAHACYGVEVVRELCASEQPEPEILGLLVELFDALATHGPSTRMLRAFELRLLAILGLGLRLDCCVTCGLAGDQLDTRGMALDGVRGGVMCATCAIVGKATKPLSLGARALLMSAEHASSLVDARSDETETESAAFARDAMLATMLAHVGKPLRSLAFMSKVVRVTPKAEPNPILMAYK